MSEIVQKLSRYIFNLGVLLALWWGISNRNENFITAEFGVGYALGIVGGVLMLLLLIYPLRKRVRLISRLGSVKFWFKTHMIFGVLGPVLVLFHSNFQVGSLNSTIAMVCMLTVAGSGLIGRFLYAKIHHGLYGSQIQMKELQAEASRVEENLKKEVEDESLNKAMHSYSADVFEKSRGVLSSIVLFISIQLKTRLQFGRQISELDREMHNRVEAGEWSQAVYKAHKTATRKLLGDYYKSIRKTATYRVSERLFALWHLLHLPIFFMMLISAITHVFVVHLY